MLRFYYASLELCAIIAAQPYLIGGVLGTIAETNEQAFRLQEERRLAFLSAIRQSPFNHHRRELQLQQQEVCRDDGGVNTQPNVEGFIKVAYDSECVWVWTLRPMEVRRNCVPLESEWVACW